MSFMDSITSSPLYKDTIDLGKAYLQGKSAPAPVAGAMNAPAVNVAGDGTSHQAGTVQPVTASNPWAEALAPLAQAYAARESNRELNKNPPYWLYGMIGLGLVGVYIVVRK